MNTLNCIIVDDEPLAARLLASYAERTELLNLSGVYTSAEKAFDEILRQKPDIVFLDIQMPEMSGLEIARHIPDETRIVFTTAYPDFALDGYKVNALHYLLKPISYPEFLEAVGRASKQHGNRPQFISVKSEYRIVRLPVDSIVYVEGLKDYVKIYLDGEPRPVLTLMSMKAVEAMLPSDTFMRVHRSYIANISRMRVFEQGRIVYGETKIPVSDSFRAALMSRLKK